MKRLLLLPALLGGVLFAACGGYDDDDATPTRSATSTVGPSVAVDATVARTATPTTAASPPADGTVDPLNTGDTVPVNVKSNPDPFTGQALLKDVRMGVHPEQGGWDRIVFEFQGPALPPATIQYVNSASQCGSGAAVALKGAAILQVRIGQAAAHDQNGSLTFTPPSLPGPGTTILEAKSTCDFEGVVVWALGIKGKQNFKVTTLQNPTRLVIDIKQ
jgi:uncharacterized protein YdeI (BOF family)